MTKIRRYVYDGIDEKGYDLKTKMLSNKIGSWKNLHIPLLSFK